MDKKRVKKEIRDWLLLIGVAVLLYTTGWYKDLAGWIQRGALETGLFTPSITEEVIEAEYAFDLIDSNGDIVPFSTFQSETIFLNIWATWCPPCIAEMPDIHDLYEKTGDQVTFVMISVDDDPEVALSYLQRMEYDFPVFFLKDHLPTVFASSTIPTTYVISPDGHIVVTQRGMSKYDSEEFRTFLLGL